MAKARKTTRNHRPSKYRAEFCEALIQHMSQGLSFNTFAGTIGVTRETLYYWINEYEQFAHAKDIAFASRARFFEQKMIDGINNGVKMGATPLLIFALKNLGDGFNFTDKHTQQIESNNDIVLFPVFGTHNEVTEGD